jgi:hypothetical protein
LSGDEKKGPGPGGEWSDSAGNMFKWGDKGITVGNAGMGKLIITDDEISIKMSAAALTGSMIGAMTVI